MKRFYIKNLLTTLLLLCSTAASAGNSAPANETYALTMWLDGEIYQTVNLAAGAAINLPAAPAKEGYEFVKWGMEMEIDIASNADAMLYTNAPCTNTQYGDQFTSWQVLFDGNAATFFHSEYANKESADGLDHYLRVDMGEGKSVTFFTFTYTNRNTNSYINAPKTMVVEGSNTADGEYVELATLTNLSSVNSNVYNSEIIGNGTAYRYIRYRVTETHYNQEVQGHPFFFIAEFGMYDVDIPTTMPATDISLVAVYKPSSTHDEYITWTYANGILSISGRGAMDNYDYKNSAPWSKYLADITAVVIEDGVTSIGDYAFYICTGLTSVIIPNSVTSIGNFAFSSCSGLTSVTIPNSVTSIGNYAFRGCSSLTSVTIPNSVTSIGYAAFEGCSGLTSVTIGNSVTSIGDYAFRDCTGLKTVINYSSLTFTIRSKDYGYVAYYADNVIEAPNGSVEGDFVFGIIDGVNTLVEYIGNGGDITLPANYNGGNYTIGAFAFWNCESLTSVTIPNSVTSIGNIAFYNCTGLTSITIPNSVESIGKSAFEGCTGLTSVTIGNSVTSIGDEAFRDCYGLTSITIPNSVTSIGEYAFCDCTGLTSVTIGNSVTSIGNYAFLGCTGLKSVIIPNSVTSIGNYAFRDCTGLTSVTIGNSVTSIGNYAFYNCTGLTSITIPNSVESIGESAFYGCTGLTSITIGNSVTSIGGSAFYGCTGLKSVIIPNSVTSIGGSAFRGCDGLTSVFIPNSVTSIGDNAFLGCTGLTIVTNYSSLTFTKGSSDYGYIAYYADKVINAPNGSVEGDFAFDIIDGVNTLVKYIGNGGDVVLPATYNGGNYTIGADAFRGCYGLTSVTIPNSVTSIGDYAFSGCSGLTSITIPNSVTSIGNYAFSACSGLTSITIPNSVTSIGNYAFNRCSGLTSVTIPNSVTSIGNYAFNNCTGLTSITIGNSVTSIGDYAFRYCDGLTSITIPNSVTSIGYEAFYDCDGLTSVIIGNSVTSIGNYAFYDCDGLTSVIIGNSVTTIGDYAFRYCYGLKTVINNSSLTLTKDSKNYGYVAYYADNVIKTLNGSIEGDFVFDIIDGVNTLAKYIGKGGDITLPANYNGENYTIGADAFSKCYNLKSVIIPNSVTSIGGSAFSKCYDLTSITIPNSVTSIGNDAFYNCTGLTSITIPNSVTSIGEYAFSKCSGLTSVTIPNSVTSIGDAAFYACDSLTSVTIGNSVTSIGGQAFSFCSGLTSITIPNSVTSIGGAAFWNCTGLTSVIIGNSVTSIGDSAFYGCTGLKTVINYSSLTFTIGLNNHGFVAYYADNVIKAPNGSVEGDFVFGIIDGVNTLVKYIGNGGDITLPANYNGGNYTIGASAFFNCDSLTSVTIPNSVTSIGGSAFQGCSGLTSVTIPNSVTSIGGGAFQGCSGLTSITIPNSVTSIENSAFDSCTGLTSITIPNSVTSIGGSAFQGCSGLTSVTIPNSVTSIENNAFLNCPLEKVEINTRTIDSWFRGHTSIKEIIIGNSVTSIGDYAFRGCRNLTSITIPNSVTSIGGGAFSNCDSLTAVHISDLSAWCKFDFSNVDSNPLCQAKNLYLNGEKITNLVIPSDITEIKDYAFRNCTGFTSVTIPNSVTTIGDFAFQGCSGLTSVTIPNSVTSIGSCAFDSCTGLTSVIIPDSVTSIGDWAFYNCTGLTSVEIGNSVTTIEDYAFYNCTGLKTVKNYSSLTFTKGSISYGYVAYYAVNVINVPNGSIEGDFVFDIIDGVNTLVKYIGNGGDITLPANYNGGNYTIGADAFHDCYGLTSITIPNSVTSIGGSAFQGCSGLTSVTIGNSVTSIGDAAFYDCDSLTAVHISDLSAWCKIDFSNVYSNPLCQAKNLYLNGEKITNLVIPSDITVIKDYAFYNCTGLTSVTIPNSVIWIGSSAFDSCTGLTSVIIGNSVTTIGYKAFRGCTGLTSVEIGNSVTSIGIYAFESCTGLTSVEIGNSVTTIGDFAFRDCTGLTNVTIPNSVTSIRGDAFYNCDGLTAVHISDLSAWCKIDFSNVYSNPLYYAKNLYLNGEKITDLVIPSDITEIKHYAFYNCTGLTSVTIGNSVTSIGDYAFYGCTGLKTVINYSSLTFTIGSSDYGYVAYYADKVITDPNGSIEGDFVFDIIDGVNTLVEYIGNGGDITLPANYNGGNYTIGADAFYDCTGLTSVTIPNSVTSIGGKAFESCTGLTSITIPNSVTSIGSQAFVGCDGLTSITIGNSVTSIGNDAFWVCTGLTSITVNSGNSVYDSREGCNAIIETATNTLIAGCKNTIIPGSVTSIGDYAFYNCSGLTSIEIPNSVTSIGNHAFMDCTGLTSVIIPNSVTSIGDAAFVGCDGLTSVEIGNNVTSIGDYAFYNCTGLKTVTNYSSLTFTIGSSDYGYVAYYADKVIKDPNGSIEGDFVFDIIDGVNTLVEYIGNGSDITLPANYNGENYTIGGQAFYNCTGLTSVTIPNSVTSIGDAAFVGCTGLTSVEIGNNVTSIGDYAFLGCGGLTEIYVKATESPIIYSNTFNQYTATLYVPTGTKAAYQAADYWKEFTNIMEMHFGIKGDVDGDGTVDVADVTAVVGVILNGENTTEQTFEDWTSTNAGVSSSTSQNSYTLEAAEGSVLTFDWSVSSESNYDWLIITIDGTQILKKSGSYTGSYEHTFTTAGTHTLVAEYTKDGSVNDGSDQGEIYNIKLSGSASNKNNSTADVDGDGTVDVADVTKIVSIILGTDTASAAPAKAAATRAGEISTVSADGDGSTLLINITNPGYPFSAIQFDLELPEGIEVDFDGEYYAVDLGSRTNSRKHSYPECAIQPDGSLRVVIISMSNALYNGTEGDVATASLKVNGAADGDYRFTIKNVVLSAPGSKEKLEPYTGWINVTGGVTGISEIKEVRAESNDIYDLQGCKVSNPVKGGIYIQNGKKVMW